MLLSTYADSRGGAAVAAARLLRALNQQQSDKIKADLLAGQKFTAAQNVTTVADHSYLNKWKAFARLAAELVFYKLYQNPRYYRQFLFSPAYYGIDLSKHPLVRQADIIHLHWLQHGFQNINTLAQLAKLQKPIIWTLHDMWPITGGCHHNIDCLGYTQKCGNCPALYYNGINDYSARQLARKRTLIQQLNPIWVAPGSWMAAMARASSVCQNQQIRVILSPLDTTLFAPIDKITARRALGLPENKRLLLFGAAKATDTGKGIQYIYELLSKLTTVLPPSDTELVIFGKANKKSVISKNYHTHLIGSQPEKQMPLVYSAADVFINPTLRESMSYTTMESLACGTPVVAFEVGGLTEMITHLQNGYFAPVGNTDELVNGLRWLFSSQTHYQTVAAAARASVLRFGNAPIAQQFIDLYQEAVTKNHY